MGQKGEACQSHMLSVLVSLQYLYPIICSSSGGFASNSVGGFSSRNKVVGDQTDLLEQH